MLESCFGRLEKEKNLKGLSRIFGAVLIGASSILSTSCVTLLDNSSVCGVPLKTPFKNREGDQSPSFSFREINGRGDIDSSKLFEGNQLVLVYFFHPLALDSANDYLSLLRDYNRLPEDKKPVVIAVAYSNPHTSGLNYKGDPFLLCNDTDGRISRKFLTRFSNPCTIAINPNGTISSQKAGNPRLR